MLAEEFGDRIRTTFIKNTPEDSFPITIDELKAIKEIDYDRFRKESNIAFDDGAKRIREGGDRQVGGRGPERGGAGERGGEETPGDLTSPDIRSFNKAEALNAYTADQKTNIANMPFPIP